MSVDETAQEEAMKYLSNKPSYYGPECTDSYVAGYKKGNEKYEELAKKYLVKFLNADLKIEKLIEILEEVGCECAVQERLSGHRIGCHMPDVEKILKEHEEEMK